MWMTMHHSLSKGDILYHEPYGGYFPSDQTKLLKLWDEMDIPHEEKKQIYGPIIPFIGFDIDPNQMTISVADDKRTALLVWICVFMEVGKRRPLHDFLSIAGHINWSLTVYPLLHLCLSALYAKTAGKTQMLAPIQVNTAG